MEQDKNHWEGIYRTKNPQEVSWTQTVPVTSLDFIHGFQLPKTARIIDIGGGDSRLVDYLLDEGFVDITVLDISGEALERARQRLGSRADRVKWVEQDITKFEPPAPFDCWHDRAAFHFLTTREQIKKYISIAGKGIREAGYAVIGTFSINGPEKCSGLPIRRYDERDLTEELSKGFKKIKCITEDHITPFRTKQNFLFCSFKRSKYKERS
ncbi:MAG TPA: class I SAM-dependent methyltransferase [Puia sp.]